MKPVRTQVEAFLDRLSFGEYIPNVNDCDNAAVKAREALKEKWPRLVTGICIMYGFSFPGKLLGRHGRVKWIFVGHGILVAECEGRLYYDCTTQDGKDTRRFRCMEWLPAWWHYLTHGYLVIYKTIIWGDYVPARKPGLVERLFPNTRRMWVHIPHGMATIALAAIGASLGETFLPALLTICALFSIGFLAYEVTQGDQGHIDIASWLWGLVFGAVPWVALAIVGVI